MITLVAAIALSAPRGLETSPGLTALHGMKMTREVYKGKRALVITNHDNNVMKDYWRVCCTCVELVGIRGKRGASLDARRSLRA